MHFKFLAFEEKAEEPEMDYRFSVLIF